MNVQEEEIHKIVKSLSRIEVGELRVGEMLQDAGSDIEAIISVIERISNEIILWDTTKKKTENRLEAIMNGITGISSLQFNQYVEITGEGDVFDAIAMGLNVLGEELIDTVVSKGYLENIMDSMTDALFVTNTNEEIVTTNQAATDLLLLEKHNILGKTILDFLDPEEFINNDIDLFSAESKLKNLNAECINAHGKRIPILLSASSLFDEKGNFKGIVYLLNDVTKQRETQREREKLLAILENTDDFIALITLDNKVEYLNKGGRRMLEIDPQKDIKTTHITEYFTTEGLSVSHNNERAALKSKGSWTGESSLKHSQTGLSIPVAINSFMIYDKNNEAIGLGSIQRDITEQKKLENKLRNNETKLEEKVIERTKQIHEQNNELNAINEELKSTNEQLLETLEQLKSTQTQLVQSEKMASLGVLTAGIAHEINNPVNFVYAGINSLEENLQTVNEILNDYNQLNSENANTLLPEIEAKKMELQFDRLLGFLSKSTKNIKKGAERTAEIVQGLKAFSRMDDDKLLLTNVEECLENTLLLLRNQYKDKVSITRKYTALPEIQSYPGKISQVFVNIIGNAIQAIDSTGEIRIESTTEGNLIKITIADTGSGMDEETQSRIFEPFYTTKEVGKGTGLGLSISHGIIESMGGSIKVKSKLGVGSEFTVIVPIEIHEI